MSSVIREFNGKQYVPVEYHDEQVAYFKRMWQEAQEAHAQDLQRLRESSGERSTEAKASPGRPLGREKE